MSPRPGAGETAVEVRPVAEAVSPIEFRQPFDKGLARMQEKVYELLEIYIREMQTDKRVDAETKLQGKAEQLARQRPAEQNPEGPEATWAKALIALLQVEDIAVRKQKAKELLVSWRADSAGNREEVAHPQAEPESTPEPPPAPETRQRPPRVEEVLPPPPRRERPNREQTEAVDPEVAQRVEVLKQLMPLASDVDFSQPVSPDVLTQLNVFAETVQFFAERFAPQPDGRGQTKNRGLISTTERARTILEGALYREHHRLPTLVGQEAQIKADAQTLRYSELIAHLEQILQQPDGRALHERIAGELTKIEVLLSNDLPLNFAELAQQLERALAYPDVFIQAPRLVHVWENLRQLADISLLEEDHAEIDTTLATKTGELLQTLLMTQDVLDSLWAAWGEMPDRDLVEAHLRAFQEACQAHNGWLLLTAKEVRQLQSRLESLSFKEKPPQPRREQFLSTMRTVLSLGFVRPQPEVQLPAPAVPVISERDKGLARELVNASSILGPFSAEGVDYILSQQFPSAEQTA